MNIKYIVKKQQLDIMKLRARNMNTKPRSVLEDDIRHLSELLMAVTNQRDEWIRTYNKLINEKRQ
jgi:hypothetical protein